MLIYCFAFTGISLIAAVAYILEKEAIKSLIFSVVAFVCSIPLLPAWYYTLLTSGKDTAWLGWERYPFVAVGLFAFTLLAVLCIVKSVMILRGRRDYPKNTPGYVIREDIAPEREQNRAKIRAEIEQNIVPCAKTKEEFRKYLTDTLGMKETPMNELELTEAKTQFILKLRRDLLRTQGNGNPDNPMAQFLEARKVPLEQTGFEITKYAMEYYVDDYKLSDVTVFLEENSFTYYASGESYVRNDEDDRIARHLYDNIALFRGVTAEDIDTKSEWYDIYVTLLTGHALEEARR